MAVETPARSGSAWRWGAAAVVASAPVLASYVAYTRWSSRLPDPLPTHWGRHAQVDGTTELATFFAIMLGAGGVGALVALAGALASRLRWRTRRWLVCIGATVSAFTGGLWLMIARLSLDHADPYQVPSPTWHIPALLVGTGAWTALAVAACGRAPAHPGATGRPRTGLPRVDLPAGQRAAWSEVSYPGLVAYTFIALLLGVTVALGLWANLWLASPVLLSTALVWYLFTIGLVVNERGLHAGFGPWRWPRVTVPLAEIESAETTTIRAVDWGGWGYRVRPGGRAVVARSGPGIRLWLSDGREFVATTRDPDAVAGLVNTMLDRSRR